ncbi:MAG: hypothetical protein WCV93_04855 [Candidatus Shapirobacteria bacterium]|jgi:hypothetical protein
MIPDEELLEQIKKLNQRLDYITNPFKNAGLNFVTGIFRSLGGLFGTIVIAGAFFYFFSKIDLVKPMTNWIETILSQIQWQKVIPTPQTSPQPFQDIFKNIPDSNF